MTGPAGIVDSLESARPFGTAAGTASPGERDLAPARRRVLAPPAWVAALTAFGGSAPALYSLLAIALAVAVLMQVAMFIVEGDPNALPTAVGMTSFSLVLVAARLLTLRGREAGAAVITAVALVGMTTVISVLYEDSTVSMLMPIVAFIVVVPYLRGWRLAAVGVPAFLVACLAAASPLLPHPLASDNVWDPISAVAGGVVGLAVLFAIGWRQVRDRESATARFESIVQDLPLAVVRLRADGRVLDANEAFHRLAGEERTELPALAQAVLAGDTRNPTWSFELPDAPVPVRGLARWVAPAPDGQRVAEVAMEDLRPLLEARLASERLADIVRYAADAVISVDRENRVLSWNAAAERIFGWTAEDMLGRSADRIVPPARIPERDAWLTRVLAGETISGVETERVRRDGARLTVVVTLSPLHGPGGAVLGVSSIERDVTEERHLAARLEAEARQHRTVRDALSHLKARPTVEATADAICEVISGVEAFAHAAVLAFEPDDAATVLALWSDRRPRPDLGMHIGDQARANGHVLVARARSGPWTEEAAGTDGPVYRSMPLGRGAHGLAFVPLLVDGDVLGLLVAAAWRDDAPVLSEHLSTFVDLGAAAAAVIGSQLAARRADELERRHVDLAIRESRFRPVYQPIVALDTGAVVGYEALTRFASGARPDAMFAAAARLGVGLELEAATLGAAIGEATVLPAGQVLHVNVSPNLVLAGSALGAILRSATRPVALEITEHLEITDYDALRAAIGRLPEPVRLSVDDAGAGFASLRHILELRPGSVKLDRRLVTGIDGDPARQALIAGMVHFARRDGCTLIAEGVETAAERRTLLELGVTHGQGYLFGRPAEAARYGRPATGARAAPSRRRRVEASLEHVIGG